MNMTQTNDGEAGLDIGRRRVLMTWLAGGVGLLLFPSLFRPASALAAGSDAKVGKIERIVKSDAEWRRILTAEQYRVLRQAGTERPYSSPLEHEKRAGMYVCAGCGLALFPSRYKYDSGTGWPSFYDVLPGHVETKADYHLIIPRTEYHCARCGGHQGHVFKDGPPPTGLRYCNNGLALRFVPDEG
jgi:peptide-methionine (R)-S-oxide reductase